ncbi:LuxR C-terminal-related transcriptional regulator [Paraclostridium sordellii]|uniref:LuxR C-terminal-related transcriptional regulator n=2 Tax=Paraclostridium sordellii TaxID=1505 RepID=UPI0005E4A675|nr:response regulator transcription factor [Paeniclostridium sordellii]AUN14539.1 DNA-binding response regulator [Paeniclostridium sordellii]MBS6024667.1 response regulator transcription factor [Paeniclostridium sordellii]CEN90255.1 response regulator [[Clostridium] sordellii] [Paeniclostridium sordellii]CEO24825.1 response regulator [[Clostridium] sordellii] [Paeniclostridium sordellii]CEQ15383.1 response regulator [[Clostridium] sordellii] [Paeniclostridium sordellii]
MNILLISNSFIIKDVLSQLFKNNLEVEKLITKNKLKDTKKEEFERIDFIFMDLNEAYIEDLNILEQIKKSFKDIRIMILDMKKNEKFFKKAVLMEVEGYIFNILEKEEFLSYVKKVLNGNKVYAPDLLKSIISAENSMKSDSLTNREKEIIQLIGEGLDNKQIAKKIYIEECTVKKHVSNILKKLNLRSRKDIIIYLSNEQININLC